MKLSIVRLIQRNRAEILYSPDEQVIVTSVRKIIILLSCPRPSTGDEGDEDDEDDEDVVGSQHQHISFDYHVCCCYTETDKLELSVQLCQIW